MKKIIMLVVVCLLLAGCKTVTTTPEDVKVQCKDKIFLNDLELKNNFHPLTQTKAFNLLSSNDDLQEEDDTETTKYWNYELNVKKNYSLAYTEEINQGKEITNLYISNYASDSRWKQTYSSDLQLTKDGENQYVYLGVYYKGYEISSTMDREDNKPTTCIAFNLKENYEESEDCTIEQIGAVLKQQEVMSTLLKYILTENHIDLSEIGIDFYDDVDISDFTVDVPPVWSRRNPIPKMIEEASKKMDYTYSSENREMYIHFVEGNKAYDISYYQDPDYKTYNFLVEITFKDSEEVAIFEAWISPLGYDKGRPRVYFVSQNGEHHCNQYLGNMDTALACQSTSSDGDFAETNLNDIVDAIDTVLQVKELFTELGVNFEDYFQMKNLYQNESNNDE